MVATLLLAGPRILELSMLDRLHLDLAAREIRMPRVKTDASERSVPMLPALHEILLTQSADRRSHKAPPSRHATAPGSIPTTSGHGSWPAFWTEPTNSSPTLGSTR